MQSVTFDRDFTQPPERIFAYLADHKNLEPLFDAKIARLTEGDDGVPNGPGASWRMKLGPLQSFVETLTEVVPNELIRYRITKGSPLRDHEGVMRFSRPPAAAPTCTTRSALEASCSWRHLVREPRKPRH